MSPPPLPALPSDSTAPSTDVDPSQLQEITGGEAEIMQDIVEEFAGSADDLLAALGAAIAQDDPRGAMRAAHTLKGSSGIIGADGLRVGCLAIERAAAAGDLARVAALFPALRDQQTATVASLRALVSAARRG